MIYAYFSFSIYDLPDCFLICVCVRDLLFFLPTSSYTYGYIPGCCPQPTRKSLALSLIAKCGPQFDPSHIQYFTCVWTNLKSISLDHKFSQSKKLFLIFNFSIFRNFQFFIRHCLPDVPQITPFQHVQNITFLSSQVKLFLYKPIPLPVFPISVNENLIPLSVQARNVGYIFINSISLTPHIQAILRLFQYYKGENFLSIFSYFQSLTFSLYFSSRPLM